MYERGRGYISALQQMDVILAEARITCLDNILLVAQQNYIHDLFCTLFITPGASSRDVRGKNDFARAEITIRYIIVLFLEGPDTGCSSVWAVAKGLIVIELQAAGVNGRPPRTGTTARRVVTGRGSATGGRGGGNAQQTPFSVSGAPLGIPIQAMQAVQDIVSGGTQIPIGGHMLRINQDQVCHGRPVKPHVWLFMLH